MATLRQRESPRGFALLHRASANCHSLMPSSSTMHCTIICSAHPPEVGDRQRVMSFSILETQDLFRLNTYIYPGWLTRMHQFEFQTYTKVTVWKLIGQYVNTATNCSLFQAKANILFYPARRTHRKGCCFLNSTLPEVQFKQIKKKKKKSTLSL